MMVEKNSSEEDEEVEISRRKFLSYSKYIPPSIITVLASSSPANAATCNPGTCDPNTCNPDDTCGPNDTQF